MTKLLIWGGGPYHSMAGQAALFTQLLSPLGFQITYLEDRSAFEPANLSRADILMVMGLDWSEMTTLKPDTWTDPAQARPYEPLDENHWRAYQDYLEAASRFSAITPGFSVSMSTRNSTRFTTGAGSWAKAFTRHNTSSKWRWLTAAIPSPGAWMGLRPGTSFT